MCLTNLQRTHQTLYILKSNHPSWSYFTQKVLLFTQQFWKICRKNVKSCVVFWRTCGARENFPWALDGLKKFTPPPPLKFNKMRNFLIFLFFDTFPYTQYSIQKLRCSKSPTKKSYIFQKEILLQTLLLHCCGFLLMSLTSAILRTFVFVPYSSSPPLAATDILKRLLLIC